MTDRNEVPKRRVQFVDVLRLLALGQMVNGHTLDAVMVDTLRVGPGFGIYDYGRGLVSVAFMASAGLAYHLTTFARFDPEKARKGRSKRVLRSLWLITLGYLLRVSTGLFSEDATIADRSLQYLLRVDVLHCIGFSILVLELITAVSRSSAMARTLAGLAGLSVVALAPLGAGLEVGPHNRLWADWLSHDGASYFPVTPWAGYVLLGAALGGFVLSSGRDDERTRKLGEVPRLALAGLLLVLLSRIIGGVFPELENLVPGSRPHFFFEKLGALFLAAAPLAWLTQWATQRWGMLPRPFVLLTGETLVMYVLHLQIIFFPYVGPARLYPHALQLGPALLVVLVVLIATVSTGLFAPWARARFFEWTKRRAPETADPVTATP